MKAMMETDDRMPLCLQEAPQQGEHSNAHFYAGLEENTGCLLSRSIVQELGIYSFQVDFIWHWPSRLPKEKGTEAASMRCRNAS